MHWKNNDFFVRNKKIRICLKMNFKKRKIKQLEKQIDKKQIKKLLNININSVNLRSLKLILRPM